MKLLITCCLFWISFNSQCQISRSDEAQLLKILGEDFQELSVESNYMKYWECPTCIQDTSLIVVDQTDGAHLNGELLMYHNIISIFTKKEAFKAIAVNYVTVNEYEEFENWTRESIARIKIFFGLDSDEEASKWFNYNIRTTTNPNAYPDNIFDIKERDINADLYGLNWKKKIDYSSEKIIPYLADMYYPQPERYWQLREFDRRKFNYNFVRSIDPPEGMTIEEIQIIYPKYYGPKYFSRIHCGVMIAFDEYSWGLNSKNTRDYNSVLAQSWPSKFDNEPIYGVIDCQAEAYCYWKSVQLQQVLDKKGINYKVEITLPTKDDISKLPLSKPMLTVEGRDYTEHWRITNEDYQQFMDAVRDSSLRDYIYDNLRDRGKAAEFLDHTDKLYFDEGDLEFEYFDPEKKYLRDCFPLKLSQNIDLEDEEISSLVQSFNWMDSLLYRYYSCEMLSYERSIAGEHGYAFTRHMRVDSTRWRLISNPFTGEYYGRGYSYNNINSLGEDQTVMRHSNLQMYTFFRPIDVNPSQSIVHDYPQDLIQVITYAQAKAYYNWKYPIQFITDKSDWQDYVYPTQEQFEAIQRGEKMLIESEELEYPSPTFRYVIHLYPKN